MTKQTKTGSSTSSRNINTSKPNKGKKITSIVKEKYTITYDDFLIKLDKLTKTEFDRELAYFLFEYADGNKLKYSLDIYKALYAVLEADKKTIPEFDFEGQNKYDSDIRAMAAYYMIHLHSSETLYRLLKNKKKLTKNRSYDTESNINEEISIFIKDSSDKELAESLSLVKAYGLGKELLEYSDMASEKRKNNLRFILRNSLKIKSPPTLSAMTIKSGGKKYVVDKKIKLGEIKALKIPLEAKKKIAEKRGYTRFVW